MKRNGNNTQEKENFDFMTSKIFFLRVPAAEIIFQTEVSFSTGTCLDDYGSPAISAWSTDLQIFVFALSFSLVEVSLILRKLYTQFL